MPAELITLGIIIPLDQEWSEFQSVFPKHGRCPECADSDYIYEFESGIPGLRIVASCMDMMGPSAATSSTSQMLRVIQPSVVALLGIAGALDAECHLGDVVVAQEVCAYQEASRAEDGKEGGTFRFKYSGSHWTLAARLSKAVSDFAINGDRFHGSWKEAYSRAREEFELSADPLVTGVPQNHRGHMASGDSVGASGAFAAELLGIDRKFLALEMEAAGVARACHDQSRDWLVIRGISDFADGRKREFDGTARGGYRKLAARSAAEYLRWWLHWLAEEKRIEHCLGGMSRVGGRARAPDVKPGVLPEPGGFGGVPSYPPALRTSLGEFFVGRTEDAWRIHSALQGDGKGQAPRAPGTVLLHAAGGFGKTRLALEYMRRFGPLCYPGGLFWVDAAASSELVDKQLHGILRSLDAEALELQALQRLGLNLRDRVGEALVKAAKRGPVLYIVDNVPESQEKEGPRPPLETWCPAIGSVSLIVTSRELWVTDVHTLSVSALLPEAAESLLTQKLPEGVRKRLNKGASLKVAEWVGYHPLALEILNTALMHGLSPEELHQAARQQRPAKAVKNYFQDRVRRPESEMKQGAIEAFALSYSNLSKPQQRLARLIAQLGAEPVPRAVAQKLEPEGLAGKALQKLRDRHFVTPVEDVAGVEMYGEMHRLLADFLRECGDKPRKELREACGALNSVVQEHASGEPQDWPLLNACLPHAETVIERLTSPGMDTWTRRLHGEGLWDLVRYPRRGEELLLGLSLGRFLMETGRTAQAAKLAKHVLGHSTSSATDIPTLCMKLVLARALQAQAEYPGAEEIYEEVLAAARGKGEEHWLTLRVKGHMAELLLERGNPRGALPSAEEVLKAWRDKPFKDDSDTHDTLRAMARVSMILRALGRADKAKDLQRQVLEERRQITQGSGAESPSVCEAMSDLALSLYALRDLSESKSLQEQVLEARKRILGKKHPDTLVATDHLAETLRELLKYDEASALQEFAVEAMKDLLGAEHPLTLQIEGHYAVTLRKSGKAKEAKEIHERVLKLLGTRLGEEHPSMLTVKSELAQTLHCLEMRWADARQLQMSVVMGRSWALGEKHPDTLEAIMTLTRMLQEQGQWKEAAQWRKRAMEEAESQLGADHPATLRNMSYLALFLAAQRSFDEARSIQEWVLKERLRKWGEAHPDTLMARKELATTLYWQGHYASAATHQRYVLEGRRRELGPEHPATLTEMNTLAATLSAQGEHEEARRLEEAVLEGRCRVLGSEHPDTLTTMNNLAETLRAQGKNTEARRFQEAVLEETHRVLGPEHPDTLTAMNNLAATLRAQGENVEARRLQEAVAEGRHRVLRPEHPDTLRAMNNLSETLRAQGEYAKARRLQEAVLKGSRRVLGPEHPDTLMAMTNLAETLRAQGEYAETRRLQEAVVEGMRRMLGPEHPATLTVMNNLAATLSAQGEHEEARRLEEAVLEALRRVLGSEHPDTLRAMTNLAATLSAQREHAETRRLQEAVVEGLRRVLGPEHPDTLTAMNNLAETLRAQGEHAEARRLQEVVLEALRRVLGPEHPATLTAMNNLAATLRAQGEHAETRRLQ